MTGMSDVAWQKVKDVGAQVSIAVPIEMNMRHGMPPILKMQSLGMEPSLCVDVECTMTADFFTQMRVVHEHAAHGREPDDPRARRLLSAQPVADAGRQARRRCSTTRDVLRYATMNGAKALRLDSKVGSLTPGKEADIIILDATAINVAPLNQVPGAVVSLMDRTNVETVIVAGKVRKWKGQLLDVNLSRLRAGPRGLARLHLRGGRHPAGPVRAAVTHVRGTTTAGSYGCPQLHQRFGNES